MLNWNMSRTTEPVAAADSGDVMAMTPVGGMQHKPSQKPKIALALGGGAARGWPYRGSPGPG
jgi:NTE family protein